MRRGNTLVGVRTEDQVDQVLALLHRSGAYDVLHHEHVPEMSPQGGETLAAGQRHGAPSSWNPSTPLAFAVRQPDTQPCRFYRHAHR